MTAAVFVTVEERHAIITRNQRFFYGLVDPSNCTFKETSPRWHLSQAKVYVSLNQECLTRPFILFHGLYPHFLHKICLIDSSVPLWSQKWWLESKFSLNLYFSISSLSRRQYYWHEHPGDCLLYISKWLHSEKKTSNLYFAYVKIFKDILISSTTLFF